VETLKPTMTRKRRFFCQKEEKKKGKMGREGPGSLPWGKSAQKKKKKKPLALCIKKKEKKGGGGGGSAAWRRKKRKRRFPSE